MPEAKDVVIATLGASATIAGLILIFSGFLFAQAASFPTDTTDESLINKFRYCGKLGAIPFVLSMAVTASSFYWLLVPAHRCYVINWVLFGITLAATVIYGTCTILFLL